jgi:hypothetical protein
MKTGSWSLKPTCDRFTLVSTRLDTRLKIPGCRLSLNFSFELLIFNEKGTLPCSSILLREDTSGFRIKSSISQPRQRRSEEKHSFAQIPSIGLRKTPKAPLLRGTPKGNAPGSTWKQANLTIDGTSKTPPDKVVTGVLKNQLRKAKNCGQLAGRQFGLCRGQYDYVDRAKSFEGLVMNRNHRTRLLIGRNPNPS